MIVSVLSHHEAVSFALDCAIHVIAAWNSARPNDKRPKEALDATRLWLLGESSGDLLAAAGKSAADAAVEADDPDQVPANLLLTEAINAASSAAHAARAAENTVRLLLGRETTVGGINGCVAWAASFALSAVKDREAEKKWQLELLIDYLLNRATPLWGREKG